jgi:hypothetical protein
MAKLEGIDQQLQEIQVRRYGFEVNRKETHRLQVLKEADFFLKVLTKIVNEELGGVEKTIELLNNPEFHMESETEFWTKKLARSAFGDFVNYGTVSKGTVESIACLPIEQQREIINLAMNQQAELTSLLENGRDNILIERD